MVAVVGWSPGSVGAAGAELAGVVQAGLQAEVDSADLGVLSAVSLPAIDDPGGRETLPGTGFPNQVNALGESVDVDDDASRPVVSGESSLDPASLAAPSVDNVDVERSSSTRLVWESAPGVFSAELSQQPKWFLDPVTSSWSEVDVGLVPVDGAEGSFRTANAPWSAVFSPLDAGAGGVVVTSGVGDVLSWRPSGVVERIVPVVDVELNTVTYRGVWPGVDLRYVVSLVGVREELVLADSSVESVFVFDVDQRLVRDSAAEASVAGFGDQAVSVEQRDVKRFRVDGVDSMALGAPVVVGASGLELWDAPVVSESEPLAGGGSTWVIGVDAGWLKAQPAELFPLVVDPDVHTHVEATPTSWVVRRPSNTLCGHNHPDTTTFCYPRAGNAYAGGVNFYERTMVAYDTAPLLSQEPGKVKTLDQATLEFTTLGGASGTHTIGVWSRRTWAYSGGSSSWLVNVNLGNVGSTATANVKSWVSSETTTDLMFRGLETSGGATWKTFAASLFLTWSEAPVSWPTIPKVVTTATPAVRMEAGVSGAFPLIYTFEVATSPGFESGTVVFTHTTGARNQGFAKIVLSDLKDGTTYFLRARVESETGLRSQWQGPRVFRVDQRLGASSVSPMDNAGPVGVNLATGNVTTSIGTPSYGLVGGSLGMSFTYNSLGEHDSHGLPERWSMSGVIPESEFSSARINPGGPNQGGSITLTRPDGSTLEFLRHAAGSSEWYVPVDPIRRDVVSVVSGNLVRVVTEYGMEYDFAAPTGPGGEGVLAQVRQLADVINPASPLATWSGSPVRLTKVVDPVSG